MASCECQKPDRGGGQQKLAPKMVCRMPITNDANVALAYARASDPLAIASGTAPICVDTKGARTKRINRPAQKCRVGSRGYVLHRRKAPGNPRVETVADCRANDYNPGCTGRRGPRKLRWPERMSDIDRAPKHEARARRPAGKAHSG